MNGKNSLLYEEAKLILLRNVVWVDTLKCGIFLKFIIFKNFTIREIGNHRKTSSILNAIRTKRASSQFKFRLILNLIAPHR